MTVTTPVKPISEIEEKSEVSVNDKILILDSETDEARLASKSELKGDTWARINSASFSWNDIVFWETDGNTVTLANAKTTLTWPKGEDGKDGTDGQDWAAATITVGTTTTWDAWTSASVTNSWTSLAAVFNFTIPKGDKWDTWSAWSAATITVWSTTTWDAGTSASVVNSGTSSAAVLDFTIPKWDKGDTGSTWATGNGISSITSSKVWKTTTVTITETNWDIDSFTVEDWADGQWSWDVIWPNSATDWNLAVFDWTTWKLIKDWWAIPTIVDSLTSQSTTSALSANQGYILKWYIDNLMAQGKFLSLWNSATWQPISFPMTTPYTYNTWDYFMVEIIDTWATPTNYKPNGSSYSWTASSTTESWEVAVWDYYVYDWSVWLLASNHWKTVSFSNLAGQPSDNVNLNTELTAREKIFAVSSTNDLTNAQAARDYLAWGWVPIIKYNSNYYYYSSWDSYNIYFYTIWESWVDDSWGYASSLVKNLIRFTMSGGDGTVTSIATGSSWVWNFLVLRTGKNYWTPYTPEYDGSPATKKYVDDHWVPSSWTTWDVLTKTANGYAFSAAPVTSVNWQTWAVTWLLTAETVVSGDSGTTYTIKVSNSEPAAWTPATTITFVTA